MRGRNEYIKTADSPLFLNDHLLTIGAKGATMKCHKNDDAKQDQISALRVRGRNPPTSQGLIGGDAGFPEYPSPSGWKSDQYFAERNPSDFSKSEGFCLARVREAV